MHYYVEKSSKHRLEEATRMQRSVGFAREAQALRQRGRPAILRLLMCRLTSWAALRMCEEPRDGRAASAALRTVVRLR